MNFVRFGLIVTGRGEREFLPSLFREVMARANCTFEVIRKSEQLSPITSERRILKMVGRGQTLPTLDQEQFGLPALGFLRRFPNSYVIVIDDLESSRRNLAQAIFQRYRNALDGVLGRLELQSRACIHFLVNMLEAYYFADSSAVNACAGRTVLTADFASDVESIGHPKNDLKYLWNGFDEVEHGSQIVRKLDLTHVLAEPSRCCWLRNLFDWCVVRLIEETAIHDESLIELFQLPAGCRERLTANQ